MKNTLPKICSLVICLLMMTAASISVNKTLFGKTLTASDTSSEIVPDQDVKYDDAIHSSDGIDVINTTGLTKTIGYGGPVPLAITISEGKISEIEPLPNFETPGFFNKASIILNQWMGKTPEEALKLNVDAVSGATYSSEAIKANMQAGLSLYTDARLQAEKASLPLKMWFALGVTLAACIIPLFVKNRLYNIIQLSANIVVLGFWCGQFLDYTEMLRFISVGFNWPVAIVAILMLIAAFIYPLFGHPQHYCNHICPLGSAQILMAQICHYKIHMSKTTLNFLEWFRKILWALLMLSLWSDVLTGWLDLELFQAFLVEVAPLGIIIAAGLFILLSMVIARPYCRFVCPTGSLFKMAEYSPND